MLESLLAANAAYADDIDLGRLAAKPARELAVLTCMDVRIAPLAACGLQLGDAHVLRNAGARVTDDVVRSLAVSVHVFGVRDVLVITHTSCGMTAHTDDELAAKVAAGAGATLPEGFSFRTASSPESSAREDTERLRRDALFAGVGVHGLVYDVATGRLHPLD